MASASPSLRRDEPVETVACPQCDRAVDVALPASDVDLTVRAHVALVGDHEVLECPAGHRFWVYFC